MNDKHREKLLEEYEEITMELLMDEYAEAEGEALWKEFQASEEKGEVPDIPDDLDQKCKDMIRTASAKINRRVWFAHSLRTLGKVAVITLVFFGLSTTLVLSVDALRVPVLNFFLRDSERYTVVAMDERNQEIQKEFEDIQNGIGFLIPEGYNLVTEDISEHGSLHLVYQDGDDGIISLSVVPGSGLHIMDTEDADSQKMKINGMDALFIEKDGNYIVWVNPENELSYNLFATTLDSTQFWEMVYALAS